MTDHPFDPEEVARFEHATWSRCAGSYMEGFGTLMAEAVDPLLDAAAVQAGTRVLDLGCGPGLVTAAAVARGAAAQGLDFSDAMVAEARQRHPALEFHQGSADALPFEGCGFDAIVSNFMLHHVGRPDQVLREACRTLREGGRASFTVWGETEKLEAFGLFFAAVGEHAGAAELPHGPLFGVSDCEVLAQMAREAGFAEAAARPLPMAWRTPSMDPFVASFRDWADLGAFPPETREAIENSVRKGAEAYRVADGYVMPNPAILITGVK